MEEENFADKWAIEPEKAKSFLDWLERAKAEIVTNPMLLEGVVEQSKLMKSCFGDKVTNRAYNRIGEWQGGGTHPIPKACRNSDKYKEKVEENKCMRG